MKQIQTEWMLLTASVVAFLGVGVSIALMFLESYVLSATFWFFLLAGIACQVVLSFRCRTLRKELENVPKHRIGLLSCCKNFYGMLADLMTIVSLIVFVLLWWLTRSLAWQMVLFGMLVFSFSMHCICNGNNLDVLLRYAYKIRRCRTTRGRTQGGIKNE